LKKLQPTSNVKRAGLASMFVGGEGGGGDFSIFLLVHRHTPLRHRRKEFLKLYNAMN
jgi:hypothetical protein